MTTDVPRPAGSVLLVDDEPEILATLAAILTARGFRVQTAADATAALHAMDAMKGTGLDAVVTDILLPGPSGVDLLAAIRDRSATTQVVLMSGAPSVDTAAAAVRLGAFDYLTKPVSGTQLVEVLRRAIDKRAAAKAAQTDRAATSAELEKLRAAVEARTLELRESHERYRQLVESLDILVFEVDLRTTRHTHLGGALAPIFVDPTSPEGLRESATDMVHPDDLDKLKDAFARWGTTPGTLEPIEVRLFTLRGDVRWARCIPSKITERGPSRLLSGVIVDVTALHEAEAKKAALEIELASARQELDRRLLRDLEPISTSGTSRVRREPSGAGDAPAPEFGVSPAMARTRAAALLAAEHDEPVLLTGETGTGKGVLADFVHRHSRRASGCFVSLNCASLRGDLLASELFGHTKGAFTSADKNRKGLVEEAEGGTLFLDELGEMGLEVQGQLLKVLEEKTYRRVGETTVRRSDFRLVCATHRDLHAMADAGQFRKDLLYRIDVFRVAVPALRERREDIVPLARHLLVRAGASSVALSTEAERFLERLPWRGNVRELRSALIRASLLARGERLRPEHFEDFLTLDDGAAFGALATSSQEIALDDEGVAPGEREQIVALLKRFDGNRAKVARALGVARSTLYRKLDRMGL